MGAGHIEAWQNSLKASCYSERTIAMYAYLARRFLKDNSNPTRLDIITYLAARLDNGLSPAAVENERKALRSLFSFLYKEGMVPHDPTSGIARVKNPYREKPCPSVEDVKKVIAAGCLRSVDTIKMKTIIILLASTGLRLTEAASLKKESVDLKAGRLNVIGKGNRYRMVPIPPMTVEALKGYMESHTSDSPFLFPGKTKNGYAEIYNIEKSLKRACIRAEIKPFTPHQLRHFFATELLKKGAKLEVVGKILGHASIGTTADIYRHVRSDEMRETIEKYGNLDHLLKKG